MKSISNRIQQYGLKTVFHQILRKIIYPVFSQVEMIIYTIPNFEGMEPPTIEVKKMSDDHLKTYSATRKIDTVTISEMRKFLNTGCTGLYIEIDDAIAGSAWIQYSGLNPFGPIAVLEIPENAAVMKNLYIHPEFRGRRLGRFLNQARLAQLKPGVFPIAIILTENRFAVRNWESLGLVPILKVIQKQSLILGQRIQFSVIGDPEVARILQSMISLNSDREKINASD